LKFKNFLLDFDSNRHKYFKYFPSFFLSRFMCLSFEHHRLLSFFFYTLVFIKKKRDNSLESDKQGVFKPIKHIEFKSIEQFDDELSSISSSSISSSFSLFDSFNEDSIDIMSNYTHSYSSRKPPRNAPTKSTSSSHFYSNAQYNSASLNCCFLSNDVTYFANELLCGNELLTRLVLFSFGCILIKSIIDSTRLSLLDSLVCDHIVQNES